MTIVVKNLLSTVLDIPGAGLVFAAGESKTLDELTEPLAEAIQAGQLQLVSQEATHVVVVEEDEQTVFDLPFTWSGPDTVNLCVGGLVQVFGTDWTVDAEANTFEWLDAEVTLEENDVLIFVGRAS